MKILEYKRSKKEWNRYIATNGKYAVVHVMHYNTQCIIKFGTLAGALRYVKKQGWKHGPNHLNYEQWCNKFGHCTNCLSVVDFAKSLPGGLLHRN